MMFGCEIRFWNEFNILANWNWDCDSPKPQNICKKEIFDQRVELNLMKHPTLMTEP